MEFNLETAKKIWSDLGDIPVDEDDNLDVDFHIKECGTTFEKGTDVTEIWHWFEDTFNISVAKDLMNLE